MKNEGKVEKRIDWQLFGTRWALTGQYGMRPIFLSSDPKGNLRLLDESRDLLIPFDPQHHFARRVVGSLNACAGMVDPEREIVALKQQNAELRALLQRATKDELGDNWHRAARDWLARTPANAPQSGVGELSGGE